VITVTYLAGFGVRGSGFGEEDSGRGFVLRNPETRIPPAKDLQTIPECRLESAHPKMTIRSGNGHATTNKIRSLGRGKNRDAIPIRKLSGTRLVVPQFGAGS
jgi:hypothetical protein